MKYLETGSTDPYYNLAFEEYVLNHYKDDDYLMLWQNENAIIVGLHQNPLEEIDLKETEKLNVNVVRRTTGGGTVYHDLGNLNFSYITDWNNGENSNYALFLEPVISAFREVGLNVELKGRNDLLLDGKKISGNAQRLSKERILHHGTLLINSDLKMLAKVLTVSTDKIQSKGIKSVKSRVTNIQDYLEEPLTIEDIKHLLLRHWFANNKVELIQLSEEEIKEIEFIVNKKYRTWNWNFGRSPKFSYRNKKRFTGGSVEVNLEIKEGIIKGCLINGDFLSLQDVSRVEELLVEKKYDLTEIREAIQCVPLELYFGDITVDELVSCFFDLED